MTHAKRLLWLLTLLLAAALATTACGSSAAVSDVEAAAAEHQAEEAEAGHADEEEADHNEAEADTHSPGEHIAAMHNVPEEAAEIPNPIAADESSIAAGAKLFAASCAVCHGASGRGDGPAAAGLAKEPSDLTATHVQDQSDGALFYTISHGKPNTPMPAWDKILSEEERWQVVNFLRTLK